MVICNKQHLSNIWSWIHEIVKQHWGWLEKSVAYKKACIWKSKAETPCFGSYYFFNTSRTEKANNESSDKVTVCAFSPCHSILQQAY